MWYTTKELADLLHVSDRTIRRRANKGEWKTKYVTGKSGKELRIFHCNEALQQVPSDNNLRSHLGSPSETHRDTCGQDEYNKPKEADLRTPTDIKDKNDKPMSEERKLKLFRNEIDCTPYSEMPDEYLREAYLKGKLVEQFIYNDNISSKTERVSKIMKMFNAGMLMAELFQITGTISERTFRRWVKKYKEGGGDYRVLVRKYVHHFRGRSIPEDLQNCLLRLLLHPNRVAIGTAILHVHNQYCLKGKKIEVSDRTIRRWIDDWKKQNPHIWTQAREGLKAYDEKINKTILRDLNLLEVGDVWVADGHDLSFDIIDPYDSKAKRMTLVVWFDMRSRMPVGCALNTTEDAQCIALALRNAILFTGFRPKFVYLDNGKAFKAKIFTSKPSDHDLENELGGYFYRLGVSPHFAVPYNAKAKIVERFFKTVQDQYERLISSFRGRNIDDKPATLHRNEKWMQKLYEREPLTIDEFKLTFEFWMMELYGNHAHSGLDGEKPIEVLRHAKMDACLKIEPSELNYLMLCMKQRKILNNGVKHNRLWYWDEELVTHVGQNCIIRYDNFDINSILIYDEKDNYICQAHARKLQHPFVHLTDDIKTRRDLEREIREIRRIKKQHKKATEEFLKQVEGDQLIPDEAVGGLFNDTPLLNHERHEKHEIEKEELKEMFYSPQRSHNNNKVDEELHELFVNVGLKGE